MEYDYYKNHLAIKKVLLATDNSNEGAAAEKYAIEFAKAHNCGLHILTIFDASGVKLDGEIGYDEYIYQYKSQKEEELADKFQDIVNQKGVRTFFIAEEMQTSVSDSVSDYARSNKIDLIFVGAHGSSGYKNNSFGSTSCDLIKNAEVPVLVVPKYAQWSPPLNVAFACKGLLPEIELCEWLLSRLDIEMNNLQLVHVTEGIEGTEIKIFEEKLREIITHYKVPIRFIQGEDIMEALDNFIATQHVNLLVIVGAPKSFFQKIYSINLIRRMSYHIQLPLLYLPN